MYRSDDRVVYFGIVGEIHSVNLIYGTAQFTGSLDCRDADRWPLGVVRPLVGG